MQYNQIKVSDYELNYYLKPGEWMSDEEIQEIHAEILEINKQMGNIHKSGIFKLKKADEIRHFLSKLVLCVIKLENGELAGFFYNFIIEDYKKPIVHLGLVVIMKNTGKNVMYLSYAHSNLFLYKTYGPHYITNISGCPSIIGTVSENFEKVWPSPFMKNAKFPPSKEYPIVAEKMVNSYMGEFFPAEYSRFDKKRFILHSKFNESGFSYDLRSMAKHKNINVLYFCHLWIKYEDGEDLVQVGRMTFKSYIKIALFLAYLKASYGLKHIIPSLVEKAKTQALKPVTYFNHSKK